MYIGKSEVDFSKSDLWAFDDPKPLRQKLISLSACGRVGGTFAKTLNNLGAAAVVRPLATVSFTESAVFFAMFYFSLLKQSPDERNTSSRLAQYIDCFGRVNSSYRGIGGTGAFRLDYWWRGDHVYLH